MERHITVINDRTQGKSLTALRISAHKLKIERGRYSGQSKEERLCAECNVVEDEINFFCDCTKYLAQSTEMLKIVRLLICQIQVKMFSLVL